MYSNRKIVGITYFSVVTISFLINLLLNIYILKFPSVWILYSNMFLATITFLVILIFDFFVQKEISLAGYSFIAMMFLKIIAIFIFLYLFKVNFNVENDFVLYFSILYLLYLFFSMFLALKLLKIRG